MLVTKIEVRNLKQHVDIKLCAKLGNSAMEMYGKILGGSDVKGADFLRSGSCRSGSFEIRIMSKRIF